MLPPPSMAKLTSPLARCQLPCGYDCAPQWPSGFWTGVLSTMKTVSVVSSGWPHSCPWRTAWRLRPCASTRVEVCRRTVAWNGEHSPVALNWEKATE